MMKALIGMTYDKQAQAVSLTFLTISVEHMVAACTQHTHQVGV